MTRGGVESFRRTNHPERGQTSIDFLVGIGVFLLTTGFIFGFVPGLLAPFGTSQSVPLVADRVADTLVEDQFVDGPDAEQLNERCVIGFFNATLADGSDCSSDQAETDLAQRVGIDRSYRVNVSLVRTVAGRSAPEPLCADESGLAACGPGSYRLAGGDRVPETHGSVVSASRIVQVNGHDALVLVRVW